jgi:hypothetical protein
MKYRVIPKPSKFMYPYIAMHGHLTKRDRPDNMDHMHYNTIYIRDDIKGERKNRILLHEYREMELMEKGLPYKKAHRRAGY